MTDFPRFNPLKGRRGAWLRQHSDVREKTPAEVSETLRDYLGGNLICQKVMDGLSWQGWNDENGTTPIWNLDDVETLRDQYASLGVAFCPVVVPRQWTGRSVTPPSAEEQGWWHGAIARLCGCLMVDLEPYAGFWETNFQRIPVYTRTLRESSGNAFLINQPDPREFALQDARTFETAGDYDAVSAQHYVGWTAGGVNWTNVSVEVQRFRSLSAYFSYASPTLYGVDSVGLATEFYRLSGARSFHVFALGPMNAAQLHHFRDQTEIHEEPDPIPGTEPTPPTPTPPTPEPGISWDGVLRGMGMKALQGTPESLDELHQNIHQIRG